MIKEDLEQEKLNEEFEEKLKINFSKCDEDNKKCVESNEKRRNIKFILLLCSFVCLLIICCIGGLLLNNNLNNPFININIATNNFDEPSTEVYVIYKKEKKYLHKGEDLLVKVYYGTVLNYPDDYTNLDCFKKDGASPNDVFPKLKISYGRLKKKLVDQGDYPYTKPYYEVVEEIIDSIDYKVIEEFDSFEDIVIPSSVFNEEVGFISFSVNIFGVFQGEANYFYEPLAHSSGIATLYYRKNGNIITLYDSRSKIRKIVLRK